MSKEPEAWSVEKLKDVEVYCIIFDPENYEVDKELYILLDGEFIHFLRPVKVKNNGDRSSAGS